MKMPIFLLLVVALAVISSCTGVPILSSNNRILLHLDPNKLALEPIAEVNATGLYNMGAGRALPGSPNGDKVIVRGYGGGEPLIIDVALTGQIPGHFGLPERSLNGGEEAVNQLLCHTGRVPQAYSAWLPAEDTRTASGKLHNYLIGLGAAYGQRVRLRFSNQPYDIVHPFFKNHTDGLFLEWKGGHLYAYSRNEQLTDEVGELLELGSLHMSRFDEVFRTDIVSVQFNTKTSSCSVVVNGRTTILESSHCDPGGDAPFSLAIESVTNERNNALTGGAAYPTAFCMSTLQVHSKILE